MLRFTQVDVFTDRFMLGNPVAVVHDADGLSDDQMAAFARWTNLSETTYLLAATDPAADYRLRIFTTGRELPFAGHPTLGSARAWLAAGGRPRVGGEVVQQCGAGLIRLRRQGDRLAFAAPPLLRGGPVASADVVDVARAVGVEPDEVVDAQWADNGPGWVALLLRDAQRVLSLTPDPSGFGRFPDIGVIGPHPPGSPTAFEVRAFMAVHAGSEDPVTGSLNAALAQWLIPAGYAPRSYVVAQGSRLGRRGRVHLSQDGDQIWVGGHTIVGITGQVVLAGDIRGANRFNEAVSRASSQQFAVPGRPQASISETGSLAPELTELEPDPPPSSPVAAAPGHGISEAQGFQPALEEDQWVALAPAEGGHATEDEFVVASVVDELHLALHPGQRAGQQR